MKEISKETLERLPAYHRFLIEQKESGKKYISSTIIAKKFNYPAIVVRKDLSSIGSRHGKPKLGFLILDLIQGIEQFLGYNNITKAVIVGVGQLGKALLSYNGFKNYGLNIVAGFDIHTDITDNRCPIYDISQLPLVVASERVAIGIITVPADKAQQVADVLIESGIKAIWNFASVNLDIPSGIAIKNEDMAVSLAVLSKNLATLNDNNQQR